MEIRLVDPADIKWEQDHAVYRVYFWDTATVTSHEHEITGADIEEVLAWTHREAQEHGWSYTVYAKVSREGALGGPGLIRLAGVLGDPFACVLDPDGAHGPASFTISISEDNPDQARGTSSTKTVFLDDDSER
ncbi:MAG: hypothetical protein JO362_21050 [Streptomycetaceae bacterium]|nr:hypothetical protein [Streptomycetaceae bacterium]